MVSFLSFHSKKINRVIIVGQEEAFELVDAVRDFSFVGENLGVKVLNKYLVFKAELPPLGYSIYNIEKIDSKTKKSDHFNNVNGYIGYEVNFTC